MNAEDAYLLAERVEREHPDWDVERIEDWSVVARDERRVRWEFFDEENYEQKMGFTIVNPPTR